MTTETFRYSRSAPKSGWCFWCRRAVVFDDMEARRLDNDEWMCGDCWSKADVGPDVPLTYEEQEGISDGD
jgi:hypothetical protein